MTKKNSRNSPRRLLPTEHQIQVSFTQWWESFARSKGLDPRLGFAIPNGGQRHYVVAAKLKAEGVKPGVPDWFIALPRQGYHGLFIEFKSEKGIQKGWQKGMANVLAERGYMVALCHSFEDARLVVLSYLGKFQPQSR